MGRRKGPEQLSEDAQRSAMLQGITDKAAIFLYDEAMAALEKRGHAGFAAALQLRDACQWTVMIDEIQKELCEVMRLADADDKRIAALIRNKQAAEDARRRVLDGLRLTPQRKRGRPPKGDESPVGDGQDDEAKMREAWNSFEDDQVKTVSDGGFDASGADDP